MQEVGGSIPPSSTNTLKRGVCRVFFVSSGRPDPIARLHPFRAAPGKALLGEILGIYISRAGGDHRASIGAAWRPARACSVYLHERESGGFGNPLCCQFPGSPGAKLPLRARDSPRMARQNPLQLWPSVYIKFGPKGRIRRSGHEPFLPWRRQLSVCYSSANGHHGGSMSTLTRQTISLQASAEVIAAIQKIADQQGRPFQAVLEDALRAYVELQDGTRPRTHVLEAFEESLQTYDALYRELAK